MITDREWDEMRVGAQLRLQKLRDEIKQHRLGNRAYAIEGARNATEEVPAGLRDTNQENA